MKQLIFTIIVLLIGLPAMAGNIYRWVDKNGVYHFSDTPPTDTNLEVETIGTTEKTPNNVIRVNIYKDFKYTDKGWPFGLSVSQTRAVGMFHTPYEQLTREPSYSSTEVLYGYLQVGNGADNRITFAVDGIGSPTWMVYFDKNNNQDLTDDGPPYTNQGTGKFASLVTLQVEIITLQGQKTKQPYKLWFWIREDRLYKKIPYFYARCHYRGQISINGQSYNSAAFETDHHDGLFRESGICIDFDNNNKCSTAEHFFHGDTIKAGQKQYQVVLDYP